MAAPTSDGRMIRKAISKSRGFASLSSESQLLFVLLIPHFNSFGKMNGSPFFIKGEVVPLLDQYGTSTIESCLQEISEKTNVKWFEFNGLWYLHSTHWGHHQKLREDKLGADSLPSYCTTTAPVQSKSGTSPVIVPLEVEVEVEDKNLSASADAVDAVEVVPADDGSLLTHRKRKLSGKRLETFIQFWDAFDLKRGKAEAADAWLDIPSLTDALVARIVAAAKREAAGRAQLVANGHTPKWAQGWLNGRRWEDEASNVIPIKSAGSGEYISSKVEQLTRVPDNMRAGIRRTLGLDS